MDEESLFDEGAIAAIIEKVENAMRPLGLTLITEGVQVSMQQGKLFAVFPAEVRSSAKKTATEDKKAREDFNKMMAEQHEAKIDEMASSIRDALADPEKLDALLFEGETPEAECEHDMHPDGFCKKCGKGLEDA